MSRPMCPKDHEHKHGESSTCYWYGCRCVPCRDFCTEWQFYYRNMRRAGRYTPMTRVPAIGTQRRLQALATLGWSASLVGRELGVSGQRMRQIAAAEQVALETAEKVKTVYDKLWATPAPFVASAGRTIARARRLKFQPPMAWDDDSIDIPDAKPAVTEGEEFIDETAVTLAVDGLKPKLTPAERRIVISRLWFKRWSDPKIAAHIRCDVQTVYRIRLELGLRGWAMNELQEIAA